ncbi:hypothetical protein [Uliginosibacterium sp. 31-12]|uniref:hypothetical protein n=1 Tax=Uliginosibacterium sp. 31-12 TaxID=3062781 RepID=UPI0026E2C801|nr:hypothetical protein [Uliginosibacterium sp. 31-12]MDO6385570.1 hypothetical protein [Uliginosibacterium sp. 31-12]
MQFALVLALVVAGLITLAWSFLFGALLIVAGVLLHAYISKQSEEVFFAWLFMLAGISIAAEVGADLWRRLFS